MSSRDLNMRARFPFVSLRDVPIIEAAEANGFNCTSWPNVHRLIQAVRCSATQVSYPDRYTGTGKFDTGLYPDSWVYEEERAAKGVTTAYRGGTNTYLAVPSFVTSADEILKNVAQISRDLRSRGLPQNKRAGDRIAAPVSNNSKRHKRDLDVSSQSAAIIDLTTESRPALATITNAQNHLPKPPADPRTKKRPSRSSATQPTSSSSIRYNISSSTYTSRSFQAAQQRLDQARKDHTAGILARVASRLYATAGDIDADRKILRERWDADEDLKDVSTTADLAELNRHFMEVEEAINDAVNVIEERLLRRR